MSSKAQTVRDREARILVDASGKEDVTYSSLGQARDYVREVARFYHAEGDRVKLTRHGFDVVLTVWGDGGRTVLISVREW